MTRLKHQLKPSLVSHSVKILQTEKRKKRYETLVSEICSTKGGLHYALREFFPGIKRVWNIAECILVNFKKDFIVIRIECYYTELSEVFIFEDFSSIERIKI